MGVKRAPLSAEDTSLTVLFNRHFQGAAWQSALEGAEVALDGAILLGTFTGAAQVLLFSTKIF